MAEEWIIRVEGREYGPAGLELLREWKQEGRVLPDNAARLVDAEVWSTARQIPGLFEPVPAPPMQVAQPERPPLRSLWKSTFSTYRAGFFQFTCLALLVIVPSVCAQLTSAAVESSSGVNIDSRTLLAGGFAFCMFLLNLFLWPVYISGIQILSAELAAGRRIRFFALLNTALKFWPRVALLCLFVYGTYLICTVLLILLILLLLLGNPSLFSIFFALLLLGLWVWIIGRLWVNFLFWQQFAVLAGTDVSETLGRSKELARSGRELPWHRRPLWRGVAIFSFWCAFVLALSIGPAWPMVREYFHQIANPQNREALMEALKAGSATRGFDPLSLGLGIVQGLLHPLLGIAFVFLYLDTNRSGSNGRS
jgi:hypothetical protein